MTPLACFPLMVTMESSSGTKARTCSDLIALFRPPAPLRLHECCKTHDFTVQRSVLFASRIEIFTLQPFSVHLYDTRVVSLLPTFTRCGSPLFKKSAKIVSWH